MRKFVQLHFLTPYNAALLNRDERGFSKEIKVGSSTRTRVSSQSQKYHWRNYDGDHAIRKAGDMAIRSRQTFAEKIARPLAENHPPRLATAVTAEVQSIVYNEDGISGASDVLSLEDDAGLEELLEELYGDTPKVIGPKEVAYLRKVVEKLLDGLDEDAGEEEISDAIDEYGTNEHPSLETDLRANLNALGNAVGIDGAMHGRMVTSDILARVDGAAHVAHAFTVQERQRTDDFFTSVDQLSEGGGGSHMGTKQLTSGLYYQYVAIDVPLLTANLMGCTRQEAKSADFSFTKEVLSRFVHTVARVSIGAKKGSTAPHSRPIGMLGEVTNVAPRKLDTAFVPAIDSDEPYADALESMVEEATSSDGMFDDQSTERMLSARIDIETSMDTILVDELAEQIANKIQQV